MTAAQGGEISLGRRSWLDVKALFAGLLTGIFTTTAYTYADGLWDEMKAPPGAEVMIPSEARAHMAAMSSTVDGIVIIAICVPIWWEFRRQGWNRWPSAVGLGFVVPPIFWLLDNLPSSDPLSTLVSGFPYAVSGALAGGMTWRQSRDRIGLRANADS